MITIIHLLFFAKYIPAAVFFFISAVCALVAQDNMSEGQAMPETIFYIPAVIFGLIAIGAAVLAYVL